MNARSQVDEINKDAGEQKDEHEKHGARTHIETEAAVSKNGLLMSEQKPYELAHF